jgi:hypothetical protein
VSTSLVSFDFKKQMLKKKRFVLNNFIQQQSHSNPIFKLILTSPVFPPALPIVLVIAVLMPINGTGPILQR